MSHQLSHVFLHSHCESHPHMRRERLLVGVIQQQYEVIFIQSFWMTAAALMQHKQKYV